ncbi:MAG TPA: TIGR01459 family HAD-type hydrolase [Hyphomicrobiaceae bacterium]|nr:TIGR01459 family HAD-type hydrolase [Hyphomicrobiaceae bacterium]
MSRRETAADVPPIVENAADLLSRYDVLVCDVWGVVHDGHSAYAAAGDALARFRTGGGTVVLLSNAPLPCEGVSRLLAEKHVRRDAWDAIVSSGDLVREHLARHRFRRLHHVGPARDLMLFETMVAHLVGLDEAEAIVCTGLADDRCQTAADYEPLLRRALMRGLPLICANPDQVVDVGGVLFPCAGAIARLYEDMGGPVHWAGKPYAPAYDAALRAAASLRSRPIQRAHVLAVGDSLATDLAGAAHFGLDFLLIAQGIHRTELMPAGTVDERALAKLLMDAPARPVAVAAELCW